MRGAEPAFNKLPEGCVWLAQSLPHHKPSIDKNRTRESTDCKDFNANVHVSAALLGPSSIF